MAQRGVSIVVAALIVILAWAILRAREPGLAIDGNTSAAGNAGLAASLAKAQLKTLDGKAVSLGSYRGKWVMLNFWATWCPPCRAEMPDLETVWKSQKKAGLQVIGVSAESAQDIFGFLLHERGGAVTTYTMLQDPGGQLSQALNVDAIPRTFILNPKGQVVFDHEGMGDRELFLSALKQAGFPGSAPARR